MCANFHNYDTITHSLKNVTPLQKMTFNKERMRTEKYLSYIQSQCHIIRTPFQAHTTKPVRDHVRKIVMRELRRLTQTVTNRLLQKSTKCIRFWLDVRNLVNYTAQTCTTSDPM